MLRRSRFCRSWIDRVKKQRSAQTQQFATMEGWQHGQDAEFDEFVKARRREEEFEAFDQRVERAFNTAVKVHKAEIWNAYKRQLKKENTKFSDDTMRSVRRAVEQRTQWLRDIFSQIDADYRSDDTDRQQSAAAHIQRALNNEPDDYMAWVYERKHEAKFLGEKGKAELANEMEHSEMPDVSDEEASRYASLRMNMSAIEQQVKGQFGRAGEEHWQILQTEKDREYMAKMGHAAEKYKELLAQQTAYDEEESQKVAKHMLERVQRAQMRFEASMTMEEEREKMIDAHELMKIERAEKSKKDRAEMLEKAAQLRSEGKTSVQVMQLLKENQLQDMLHEQNLYGKREQSHVLEKKKRFLDLVQKIEERREERAGALAALMEEEEEGGGHMQGPFGSTLVPTGEGVAAAHFPSDADDAATATATDHDVLAEARRLAQSRGDPRGEKKALWDLIHQDKWEDPFLTVHQARLDARKNFDSIYVGTKPTKLRLGRKAGRTEGWTAGGGGNEHKILQDPGKDLRSYSWGMMPADVHNLDRNGANDYFQDGSGVHVQDPVTKDINFAKERKLGRGPRWNGPRFYKMGTEDDEPTYKR